MKVVCLMITLPIDFNLSAFAEACLRFSPQIALREPNIIFIEIGKCSLLYSEASFRTRMQILLKRFKIESKSCLAISKDLPSSLALARFQRSNINHLPIESLSDFSDPFGTEIRNQPIIQEMISSLKHLGIQTLEELRAIPHSQIPSRFGSIGLFCKQRIENAQHLAWPYWKPPEKFDEHLELLPSEYCADLEPLLFICKGVLDRIFSRLKGRQLRAETISFTIELEKYSIVKNPIRTWTFELLTPQGSTHSFIPILKERLYRDLGQNPIESFVIALTCIIIKTTPAYQSQRSLQTLDPESEMNEAIGTFFDQLEEYIGKGNIFWAQITEQRFPEKSWNKIRKRNDSFVQLEDQYPIRPTRILKNPLPITLIHNRFIIKDRNFKFIHWSQVERLSLDWIDDTPARNYYKVAIEGGRTLWIFSDPNHHYYLHGYFE